MTRTLLLAIGLTLAAPLSATETRGAIAVTLTLFSRCDIASQQDKAQPVIDCGHHFSAQPRVSQSVLKRDAQRHETARLVTIEW